MKPEDEILSKEVPGNTKRKIKMRTKIKNFLEITLFAFAMFTCLKLGFGWNHDWAFYSAWVLSMVYVFVKD